MAMPPEKPDHIALKIIDTARWAPSGDNAQPWRFCLVSPTSFSIHTIRDESGISDLFDRDDTATRLAVGALIENIHIAASQWGYGAEIIECRNDETLCHTVTLREDSRITPDPLFSRIQERCVQRRRMRCRALAAAEKAALSRLIPDNARIIWMDEPAHKWKLLRLICRFTDIRLRLPEAYNIHRSTIEFHARFSKSKMPDEAIGFSRPGTWLMRWSLQKWSRIDFLNRFCGGTLLPRLELDILPGIFSGGYFALARGAGDDTPVSDIECGRLMQRVWLTATALGLQMQPAYAPVIFSRYARNKIDFTANSDMRQKTTRAQKQFDRLFGPETALRIFFIARVGEARPVRSRSLRLDVSDLIIPCPPQRHA